MSAEQRPAIRPLQQADAAAAGAARRWRHAIRSPIVRRRAPQGLDLHGRQAPVHNSPEDDQLEIPAFLRRQAN